MYQEHAWLAGRTCDLLTTRAIPQSSCGEVFSRRAAISSVFKLYSQTCQKCDVGRLDRVERKSRVPLYTGSRNKCPGVGNCKRGIFWIPRGE